MRNITAESITRFVPPDDQGRHSAVLVLLGESERGPDVLLIERARTMRNHAGEPAFPGGALDDTDADAAAAAVREAHEETGLDPSGVVIFGQLPDLWVPVNDFVVTPVMGWWCVPSPVHAKDLAEVASVHRIPVAELTDPANRCLVRHPSGYIAPGFTVRNMVVWGFTAGVLSKLFDRVNWSQPWDTGRMIDIEAI
ncbi:MAG: CoA pyrophosphatase [Actinomycetota bacterium]|nr:CoA pyrophosphatase [Actinomycetota bacterium]